MELLAFNSSRTRLREENSAFAATIAPGARVLDAGAGDAPYRDLFAHTEYESADFEQVDKAYGTTTHVCDLAAIPVEDGRYDALVFNQVMEHLPDPGAVISELHRVLKPGGRMIYSGPLFFEEHEQPYDFYRYTRFGVRHLFERGGFQVERLDWLEGFFGTVGYQLNRMARYLPSRPRQLGGGLTGLLLAPSMVVLRSVFAALSVGFHRLELRAKVVDRGYPKNYVAILTKASA
ncbi:MAG: class I SAM-dependent methyltransferase [Actinomycetota bacterium]